MNTEANGDPEIADALARAQAALERVADEDDELLDEVPQRGEIVESIYRSSKREQLRVVLDDWNGCQFATLRIWFRDSEDPRRSSRARYLPTCRGVTIRPREFPQVLAALHGIARRLGVEPVNGNAEGSGSVPP